jgi:hypothetical protein
VVTSKRTATARARHPGPAPKGRPKAVTLWNCAALGPHVQVMLDSTALDGNRHETRATFQLYSPTGNGRGSAQVVLGSSSRPT